jgi:hypothetical protein
MALPTPVIPLVPGFPPLIHKPNTMTGKVTYRYLSAQAVQDFENVMKEHFPNIWAGYQEKRARALGAGKDEALSL